MIVPRKTSPAIPEVMPIMTQSIVLVTYVGGGGGVSFSVVMGNVTDAVELSSVVALLVVLDVVTSV